MGIDEFFCAAVAGMISRAPCHPLDTIKTVAYTADAAGHDFGFRRGFQDILAREGIRGFYRGVGIATFGSAPGVGTYLLSYEVAKRKVEEYERLPKVLAHLACGLWAEAVSCIFWVPIDVVKERCQSQHPGVEGRYTSSLDGFRTVVRNESWRGLYKGYWSTLASFGPTSAIYFMAYEEFNKLFEPLKLSPFVGGLLAAGLGNAVAAVATNPLEMVKTRLQVQRAVLTVNGIASPTTQFTYNYKSFASGLNEVVKEYGIFGLQRGVVSRMMYTVPNAAMTMALYQAIKDKVTTAPAYQEVKRVVALA